MSKKKSTAAAGKIYDFCGKKKMILAIAVAVILALIVGIAVRGVDLAIEFKGGTMLTYSYTGDLDINAAAAKAQEIVGVNVSARQGEDLESDGYQLTLSFSSEEGLNADRQFELTNALTEMFPDNGLELFDSNDVSPSSGREFLPCNVSCGSSHHHLYRYKIQQDRRLVGRYLFDLRTLPRLGCSPCRFYHLRL